MAKIKIVNADTLESLFNDYLEMIPRIGERVMLAGCVWKVVEVTWYLDLGCEDADIIINVEVV